MKPTVGPAEGERAYPASYAKDRVNLPAVLRPHEMLHDTIRQRLGVLE